MSSQTEVPTRVNDGVAVFTDPKLALKTRALYTQQSKDRESTALQPPKRA